MKAPSLDQRLQNVLHFFWTKGGEMSLGLLKQCASGVKGNLIFMSQKQLVKKLYDNSQGRLSLVLVPVVTERHSALSKYQRTKDSYLVPLIEASYVVEVLTRSKQKYALGAPLNAS